MPPIGPYNFTPCMMHSCLRIPEILTNILDSREDQENLVLKLYPLTLVCKTFCEPALDLLWAQQSDFRKLLKCFPPDLLAERGEPPELVTRSPNVLYKEWSSLTTFASVFCKTANVTRLAKISILRTPRPIFDCYNQTISYTHKRSLQS